MPDPNKLNKLASIGYRLRATCGLCRFATFAAGSAFGTCSQHTYEHAKHGPRPLSVHVAGSCPSYATDAAWAAGLVRSGFDRFVKGGAGG